MTFDNAPTRFVETKGTRFAYRWIGEPSGVPLICLQHFSGTLDGWDPRVIDGLARGRRVLLFDNAGVGQSSGMTPDNVAQMALDAERFISGLGLETIDLLGYSLGGMVAQQLAASHPQTVRKVMLVGSAPQGGEEHLLEVLSDAFTRWARRIPLGCGCSLPRARRSQAAGRAFLEEPRPGPLTGTRRVVVPSPSHKQRPSIPAGCATRTLAHAVLSAIGQPVLVVNGSNDTMLPADNSILRFKRLANAQLVLYPDAGHGPPLSVSGPLRGARVALLGLVVMNASEAGPPRHHTTNEHPPRQRRTVQRGVEPPHRGGDGHAGWRSPPPAIRQPRGAPDRRGPGCEGGGRAPHGSPGERWVNPLEDSFPVHRPPPARPRRSGHRESLAPQGASTRPTPCNTSPVPARRDRPVIHPRQRFGLRSLGICARVHGLSRLEKERADDR